jgi:hypothetical protein
MNKTWAHFQTMFAQAHEMYESLTVQAGGYHGGNLSQVGYYKTSTQSKSFYTETVDAFANLAMAATSDKDLINTLTSTNAALTGQLV